MVRQKHINMQNIHLLVFMWIVFQTVKNRLEQFKNIIDNLHTAENGESTEESQGATNESKLRHQGNLDILLYLIIYVGNDADIDNG